MDWLIALGVAMIIGGSVHIQKRLDTIIKRLDDMELRSNYGDPHDPDYIRNVLNK